MGLAGLLVFLGACGGSSEGAQDTLEDVAWEEIVNRARGATVDVGMWQGDPSVNAYMRDYVAERLLALYGIHLNLVSIRGNDLVSALVTELEASVPESAFDIVWINGETFYQLRRIGALHGPFTDRLPNMALVDMTDPHIALDFQQPIAGFEAPWGVVQFVLVTDSLRVPDPPRTREELGTWVRAHPERFTFDSSFTGMTFLKALLIDLAGGEEHLAGPFDEDVYARVAPLLWSYLRDLRPYLWKAGLSYPSGVAQLHQLFAAGEIDFTMSNNEGEVDNKVSRGLLPSSAVAFVPAFGSIRNTHYWGVLDHAGDKMAALVAINFLLSPEAQLQKLNAEVWGDGSVLDLARLPGEWTAAFRRAGRRSHVAPADSLRRAALAELAPEYMIRLYEDFRRHMLQETSN